MLGVGEIRVNREVKVFFLRVFSDDAELVELIFNSYFMWLIIWDIRSGCYRV